MALTKITGSQGTLSGITTSDNILFNAASKGIYLGVTSATASNLLDDYEEGTWTPTINSGTFSSTNAKYTKIGNKVTVTAQINTFSDQTNSTRVEVGGLPFTNTFAQATGSLIGSYMNFAPAATYISNNTIKFFNVNSGGFDYLEFADFNNASATIYFIATYFTDS